MKLFLKKTFINISSVYLLWVIVNISFPSLPKGSEYSSWNYKFSLLSSNNALPENLNIILGDSASEAGIKASNLKDAYNLSIPGGTPFDGLIQLKRMIKNNNKPKSITIAYSFVNFLIDDGFLEQNINFGKYSYSEILEALRWQKKNTFLISNIKGIEAFYNKLPFSSFFLSDQKEKKYYLSLWEYFLSKLYLSPIDYARFKSNLLYPTYSVDNSSKALSNNKGHVVYKEGLKYKLPYTKSLLAAPQFIPHPFSAFYIEKLLSLANQESIQINIVMTPIPSIFAQSMPKSFTETAQKYFDDLSYRYKAKRLNKFLIYDDALFGDHVHLNTRGADQFTEYLKENGL